MFRVAATLGTAAALLAGCASGDPWAEPHPLPRPVGSLAPGFTGPSASPSPESTITPAPGSWDAVHPSKGYRVVLLWAGSDAPTKAVITAVREWAKAEKVDLRTVEAAARPDPIPGITKAIEMHPDLIVSAGNDLVDPLTVVTASNLQQRFLVVGAELAEPTHNVTAVDWPGASFRGEGNGMSSTYDPASFTPARCAAAIRAGAAAVLTGLTGIVVWLRDSSL
nr:hypothetical protein [uncultured Actinoplanes sp.]